MKKIYLSILVSFFTSAYSENLGIIGKTYPISEPDMIEWIQQRASAMMKNGQWDQMQKRVIANTKNQIENPIPVLGISDAEKTKSWNYQPMIQLKKDLTDTQGHVVAKAGNYNALRYKPFDVELIFINGNNTKQVAWALKKIKQNKVRTKIILTQGSFIKLAKKYETWFYYDQHGKYSQKLNITHVPALVKQDGDSLKITEFANSEI